LVLLGGWCGSRRLVCPAVGGGGGTIPRSRAQVWGVFPGGRAHCAARGLAGEEERSGRQGSVGGSRVVARALRNLPPARCLGSRAYGHRPRRRILDLRGGSAGEVRADVMRRACPTSRHSRLIHVSQLQVWMSSSPLQPWSLLLIRDSEHLRRRRHSRASITVFTRSRVLPSGGRSRDRRQPTDLAVGGSNPSRRATIIAAQRPCDRVAG
jgi:hypothetical protein